MFKMPSNVEKMKRFVAVLQEIKEMYLAAGGKTHGHLEMLLDPDTRDDPRTLNYLKATASGTLQDRAFCARNNDHVPNDDFASFNIRYQALLDEALRLAKEMGLPAGGR